MNVSAIVFVCLLYLFCGFACLLGLFGLFVGLVCLGCLGCLLVGFCFFVSLFVSVSVYCRTIPPSFSWGPTSRPL